MTGGYIITLCVSSHLGGGVPTFRPGGVPTFPGLDGGGGGAYLPSLDGRGGYLPSQSGWGGGVPTLGTAPHQGR